MAKIPTFNERPAIDQNGDGSLTLEEQEAYLERKVPVLASNLGLFINGEAVPLSRQEQSLEFLPGNRDLETMRIEARFVAIQP